MRPRVVALALSALLVLPVVAGCTASKEVEAVWPTATAERTVERPAGTLKWPLTGMPAPSAEAITTRVTSVKIENSPAARPQTGLDKADVVYEVIAEGGITRFHCLFQSQTPAVVGPVRSCRPPDLYVIQQYHSILAHVGGPRSVRNILASDRTKYNDMDEFFNPASYWRTKDRAAPHNMYLDIAKLRGFAATKRGYPATETITGFQFAPVSETASPAVATINVPVASTSKVQWRFDAATRMYARYMNGKAHKDAVTGKQLTARNVIVLWAKISPWPGDKHNVVDIKLAGTGKASVFIGGQRIDATWTAGTTAPPTFKAADGSVIKLAPGNTWIQVLGLTQKITTK